MILLLALVEPASPALAPDGSQAGLLPVEEPLKAPELNTNR